MWLLLIGIVLFVTMIIAAHYYIKNNDEGLGYLLPVLFFLTVFSLSRVNSGYSAPVSSRATNDKVYPVIYQFESGGENYVVVTEDLGDGTPRLYRIPSPLPRGTTHCYYNYKEGLVAQRFLKEELPSE
ncbi:MAG: hypothetical protein Q8O87_02880 [bacterium]|nr:hypothetical protein [bacterium]